MSVCFYISGHGFGHAVRQIAILNALAHARPDVRILVRSSVPGWLFERSLRRTIEVQAAAIDIGAVQRSSVDIDVVETVRQAARFHDELDDRARAEAGVMTREAVRLVVADIPAVPFEAAALADIPSIGISNFTWDWIYEDYADVAPEAAALAARVRGAYQKALEGWRLPMHGGFEGFRRLRDLPLVARRGRLPRQETRERLGLPDGDRLILVSFGGYRAAGLDIAAAARDLRGLASIVVTSYDPFPPIDGVHWLDEKVMYGNRIRYEDLLGAIDIVASKPGYGIISDCAANRARLLYTSRGRFREYDVLVREMPQYLRCEYIAQDELAAGAWRAPVERLLAQPPLGETPPVDGAGTAAAWLSAMV